jgi:hypothetical protein
MTNQFANFKNARPSKDAMVLAWAAAVAICDPSSVITAGCSLLGRMAWAAFEVIRFALVMGHSPLASEGSKILDLVLQVGPCLWCLLHLAVGRG